MTYLLPDKVYGVLKWVALIALPAIAAFISTVLPTLGIDASTVATVATVINAAATLIGVLIGVSALSGKEVDDGER